jgi:predicted nucleotidyltransferase
MRHQEGGRCGRRKPKDRDFLRTEEGMFFCVTGYLHPPDRYTAYLKYSPASIPFGGADRQSDLPAASVGKWRDEETAYRRELPYYHVRTVEETIRHLEQRYPWYVHDCPVRGIRFSMVPRERVARYYDPQERLQGILDRPRDPLEEEVQGLAIEIAACAGVRPQDLGVTGSILIGLHNPEFSDIDLTVYGRENARRVRRALAGAVADELEHEGGSDRIQGLSAEVVARWSRGIADRFPLTVDQARYLAGRRWNYGFYGRRYFSLHPTRTDAEIGERYGDHVYRGQGGARVRALLVGAEDALFMPARYRVEDVQVLEGEPRVAEVREVVSYEGLYRDVADEGDEIEVRGKLESVDDRALRLVVGTAALEGRGYIRPYGQKGDVEQLNGKGSGAA